MYDYDCKEELSASPPSNTIITTSVEFIYPNRNEIQSKLRLTTSDEDVRTAATFYNESPTLSSVLLVRSEKEESIQTPVISNRPTQREAPPLLILPPTISTPNHHVSYQPPNSSKFDRVTPAVVQTSNRCQTARFSSDHDEPIVMSSTTLEGWKQHTTSKDGSNNKIPGRRRHNSSKNYIPSSERLTTFVDVNASTNASGTLATEMVRFGIETIVRFGLYATMNRIKPLLLERNISESQKSEIVGYRHATTLSAVAPVNHSNGHPIAISATTTTTTKISKCIPNLAISRTSRTRPGSENLQNTLSGKKVIGIRNYGQTCFLNSVVQALAALDSFIVYLDHMVQLNKEYRNYVQMSSYLSIVDDYSRGYNSSVPTSLYVQNTTPTRPDFIKSFFCDDVLNLLLSVNGKQQQQSSNVQWIDPRPIVHAVGQKHKQFQRRYGMGVNVGEQQDAQELLQAVLGMIIDEGQFDLTPLAVPSTIMSSFIGNNTNDECHDVTVDDDDLSLFQNNMLGNTISKAMEIMMTTTSSTSPCPLSVWCGSALMCSTCRKVRPIQNVPFLDIPVIPTATSHQVSTTTTKNRKGQEFSCRLEDCLAEFTSIERVVDVECKNCTIQAEIREQESDKAFQLQIIEGIRSRQSKRNIASNHNGECDNAVDESTDLLYDLIAIDARIDYLRRLSPDDDCPIYEGNTPHNATIEELNESSSKRAPVKLKRSDAFKCLLLTRLPSILSIHVQRRYFDPETGRTSKTTQHVNFPEMLDVSPFCAYGAPKYPHTTFAGTVSINHAGVSTAMPIWYKLMAVIEHRGGPHSGHYVCYRRDPSAVNENRWLWISDDTIRPCQWNNVRNCQAYMLFYEAT